MSLNYSELHSGNLFTILLWSFKATHVAADSRQGPDVTGLLVPDPIYTVYTEDPSDGGRPHTHQTEN